MHCRPLIIAAAIALTAAPLAARDRAEFSAIQPPSADTAPTLKVFSRETWVDVTVTDDRGNPVHGLTRDDFTILEDGQPMNANSFAEHRTDLAQPAPPKPVRETLPPNTFSNLDPAPSDGPINILLFDSSNTPAMTQYVVQRQMLDFVNSAPPGTRLAVIRLTYHLTIIQGITTDRELARAAIASDKITPGDFSLEDSGQDPGHVDPPETANREFRDGGADIRGEYTVTIMKQLARFLSGMPGRKNLIWFTGFSPEAAFHGAFKSEVDLLARSHVAVSAIDPRGPCGTALWCAEQAAMGDMADQTGGRFFASRDVATPVAQILNQGSNFYALTYTPTDKAVTSGQFRNITVKVNRPGLHLTYRPGYYATDPTRSLTNMKLPPQPTAMQAAMERGGLEPTQILFKVRLDPAASTTTALTAGSQPNAKKMKPPYRSITVSYSIDIDSIAFSRAGDGRYHADFEFGAMVYNADGDLVNTASMHVRPVLSAAAYQSMLKDGAKAYQNIDVPANGDYTLRIGVHDLASDHVGALEVPTSALAAAR